MNPDYCAHYYPFHPTHDGPHPGADDELVARCRDHIASYRATLYGQAWNVFEADDLERAAEWLASEIRQVLG